MASKHRRLRPQPNPWTDRRRIHQEFEKLFNHFRDSVLVVSYRSDGIPTEDELVELLLRYKRSVRVVHYGQYKYALSTNARSGEMLLIGV
jgi:adenine-specific DNA-methyltransferase